MCRFVSFFVDKNLTKIRLINVNNILFITPNAKSDTKSSGGCTVNLIDGTYFTVYESFESIVCALNSCL